MLQRVAHNSQVSPNGSQGLSALVADDEPSIAEKYEATADVADSGPFPVIMRATNGKGKAKRSEKIKIKTIVQPGEMDGFFSRYAELCKANMQGLKKRDKSKKKRAKRKKRNDGETEMSTG